MENCKDLDQYLSLVVDSFNLEDFKPVAKTEQESNQAKIINNFKQVFEKYDCYWCLYRDSKSMGNAFSIRMHSYNNSHDTIVVTFEITNNDLKIDTKNQDAQQQILEPSIIKLKDAWTNLDDLRNCLKKILKDALFKANSWMKG